MTLASSSITTGTTTQATAVLKDARGQRAHRARYRPDVEQHCRSPRSARPAPVAAVTAGTSTITATSEGKSGTASVVSAAARPLWSGRASRAGQSRASKASGAAPHLMYGLWAHDGVKRQAQRYELVEHIECRTTQGLSGICGAPPRLTCGLWASLERSSITTVRIGRASRSGQPRASAASGDSPRLTFGLWVPVEDSPLQRRDHGRALL